MNNKGHFLIYEAVFTIIILALIITSITTVKQQENTAYENTNHYKKPAEMMELLSDTRYKDGYLLDKLVDTTDNKVKYLNYFKKKVEKSHLFRNVKPYSKTIIFNYVL